MNITVTFDSIEEMMGFAANIANAEIIKPKKAVNEAKKAEPSSSETSMNTAPVGIEEELPFEPAKTYTLEEVRAELAKLTRAGKQKEVKELLESFGAKNLSSVKPEDYAALMEKAGAL